MTGLIKAKAPFRFHARFHISELTGLRAANLVDMANLLKTVPGACVYHHTHRFLQQHQYLSPEPPNDFAYWVSNVLKEDELGEKLASVDTVQYDTIRHLRERIIFIIEGYLKENKSSKLKFAGREDEFHFIKSMSFVIPTHYVAYDLKEFADILEKITIDSIYFHVFEARLRLELASNDFSNWVENSLEDKELANMFARLDPYTQTLEDLRKTLIKMTKYRIKTLYE